MPVPLHTVAISPLIRGLKNLSGFLKKGEDHALANGINPQEYLDGRLHPDMANLPFQIHRASDAAKFVPQRVAGVEPPSMPDNESTFAELQERIKKTIDYLEGVDPKTFEGQEEREVVLNPVGPNGTTFEIKMTGLEYVMYYAHPNFWFHVTTAYGILRMKGVDLGKRDFINASGIMEAKLVEKKD